MQQWVQSKMLTPPRKYSKQYSHWMFETNLGQRDLPFKWNHGCYFFVCNTWMGCVWVHSWTVVTIYLYQLQQILLKNNFKKAFASAFNFLSLRKFDSGRCTLWTFFLSFSFQCLWICTVLSLCVRNMSKIIFIILVLEVFSSISF